MAKAKQSKPSSRLAAIMFTDIVGYTSLMGEDEAQALELVETNLSIQKPLVERFHGLWLKEMGDGNLASFSSAHNAIHCAQEIQKSLQNHPDLKVRIGIHLGDVVFRDGDVMGDGVNIASRLESIADPGGIYTSEAVYQAVRGKKGMEFIELGPTQLKNVNYPVKTYAVAAEYLPRPNSSAEVQSRLYRNRRKLWGIAASIVVLALITLMINLTQGGNRDVPTREMSLAIIPFVDNSGSEDYAYFGLGMATEVRSKLSQSRHFELISATQATRPYVNSMKSPGEIALELNVNYLLTGFYQVINGRIKVDVEFVEANTGASLWNLRYDEFMEDVFDIQSKIANQVLQNFNSDVTITSVPPTASLDAYAHYARGLDRFQNFETADSAEFGSIRSDFLSAIQLDSAFEAAWVNLIDIETMQVFSQYKENDGTLESRIRQFVTRFPNSGHKKLVQGFYQYHGLHEYEKGYRLFQEVLQDDPENAKALEYLVAIQKRRLEHSKSIPNLVKLIRQNPTSSNHWWELGIIAQNMGDYQLAEKALLKSQELGTVDAPINWLRFLQGKEPNESVNSTIVGQLREKYRKRNYQGVLDIVYKVGLPNTQVLGWKMSMHFMLENQDSIRYYANKMLEMDLTIWQILSVHEAIGNKNEVVTFWQQRISTQAERGDLVGQCTAYVWEIRSLATLGAFTEATEKLIRLNKNYPLYGDYGLLNVDPSFDRIKAEYPPFMEAVNNLKLPVKPVLDDLLVRL